MAWAAGLFEGEGCITTQVAKKPTKVFTYPRLVLGMTDLDSVQRFADIVGAPETVCTQDRTKWNPRAKLMHVWHKMGWEFFEYFGDLLVHNLGERRRARYAEVAVMPRVVML